MESNASTSARATNLDFELAVDVGWLAGILDGEGSIAMPPNGRGEGYAIKIEIFNTSEALLDKVSRILDRLEISHSNRQKLASKFNMLARKPGNRICLTKRENCVRLLEHLLPHLTDKKGIAQAVVDLFKHRVTGSAWDKASVDAAIALRSEFMPRSRKI